MPQQSKSDLFDLVRSLSMSEKRYFKLFASLHTIGHENSYVKLFDVVAGMDAYDEESLVRENKKENFVKNISRTKNYLYGLLLKSLGSYHASDTLDAELNHKIQHIKILLDKGLYKQGGALHKRAKKLALKNEKSFYLTELFTLEDRIFAEKKYEGVSLADFKRLNKNQITELAKQKNYNIIRLVNNKLFLHFIRKHQFKNKNEFKTLEKEIKSLSGFVKNDSTLNFAGKHILYHSHGIFHLINNDIKRWNHYQLKIINLYESHPIIKHNDVKNYLVQVINLLVSRMDLYQFDKYYSERKKLLSVKPTSSVTEHLFFQGYYVLELGVLTKTGRFGKINSIIDHMEEGFAKFKNFSNTADYFTNVFHIGYCYFGAEEFHRSVKWINKIFNRPKSEMREDLQRASRVLLWINHYEFKNYDYLNHLLKAYSRSATKKSKVLKTELLLMDFFLNRYAPASRDEFKKISEELEGIQKNTYEKQMFSLVDTHSWIESKIKNLSFSEIIRKKAAKQHIQDKNQI